MLKGRCAAPARVRRHERFAVRQNLKVNWPQAKRRWPGPRRRGNSFAPELFQIRAPAKASAFVGKATRVRVGNPEMATLYNLKHKRSIFRPERKRSHCFKNKKRNSHPAVIPGREQFCFVVPPKFEKAEPFPLRLLCRGKRTAGVSAPARALSSHCFPEGLAAEGPILCAGRMQRYSCAVCAVALLYYSMPCWALSMQNGGKVGNFPCFCAFLPHFSRASEKTNFSAAPCPGSRGYFFAAFGLTMSRQSKSPYFRP